MAVANTLAYYDTIIITAVKRFVIKTPGPKAQNHFKATIYQCL